MIGIIIVLAISWLLLWLICKKHLSVLGFMPTKSNLVNFTAGFIIAGFICTIYHILTIAFINNHWVLHIPYTLQHALSSAWWVLKSVLFEELIFRGALLYILIKKLGVKVACLLSALGFGICHLFIYNIFNNPMQAILIFFMTGFMGFALAKAFVKTGSLYLPVALHFGWNLFNILVFSNGPLGQQLFVKATTNALAGMASLFVFLFQVFALPVISLLYVKWLPKNATLNNNVNHYT